MNTLMHIISLAQKKGLLVRRNSFKGGWCLTLPNGASYHATTDSDLIKYVREY
jgi:hypothetical protein